MLNELKKNPLHYLEHLEYVNRAKKIQEKEIFLKKAPVIEREENFRLFFNGANDLRVRKKSEVPINKSPIRKKWDCNPKNIQRKVWNHPETPFILKEQADLADGLGLEPEIRHSKDNIEKIDKNFTRIVFKLAGNALVKPDASKDYQAIAQRIEKLNKNKQDQILKVLEDLEILNDEDNI
jgi:hypothetical protein